MKTNAFLHGYLAGYMHKQAQSSGCLGNSASDNMCTGYQTPPEIVPHKYASIEERRARTMRKKEEHKARMAASQQEGEAMNPFAGQG
jgi:hypothetical protein